MSFGGFSSHGGSGALGALAMGLAPGAGLAAARVHSPMMMGHILEGAVGVVERRKRSAGELSGGFSAAAGGPDGHLTSFAFSGRQK